MDEFIVSNCPKCRQSHTYKIEVERSYILKMMTQYVEPVRTVKFTRFFTCPTTNEQFQATVNLTETESSKIKDVTVK